MNVSRLRSVYCYSHLFKQTCCYSSTAKTEFEIEALHKQDPKITKNVTGITVASVENYSPISQISVLVKAGARYEQANNIGIAHCLRNCTSLATRNSTAFSITRNLELHGAKLSVSSTREYLIYTLQCLRDSVDDCFELLADVVTNQAFKPWEVKDAHPRMNIDLALYQQNSHAVLMEALHKAAFRGGLSNSIYSPAFMIGKHTDDMLHDFVRSTFTASRTSVVGLGIAHDSLENSVTKFFSMQNGGSESTGASKFGGGAVRIDADLPFTHVAIVAEGGSITNTKDMLSLGVLQGILGVGAQNNHSSSKHSKLGEAAAKSTNNPFSVSTLNINYSDTGLFGVYVACYPDEMDKVVKSVVSQMREATKNISEDTLQNAKHALKTKLRLERDTSKDNLQSMVIDASVFKQVRGVEEIESEINKLTLSDVTSVAGKVMKTKPAMAAVGRLHNTPHLDELV